MISTNKHRSALLSLNAVLVIARSLAYEGRTGDVAAVLDVAEYLPMLILEPVDRTTEFRDQLVDLARRYPAFSHALDQFDGRD